MSDETLESGALDAQPDAQPVDTPVKDTQQAPTVAQPQQSPPQEQPEEEERDPSAYQLNLPAFHGPLDLLLHLIKKHEVDIYDIPILLITDQYNAYLDTMTELDLDVAADYIYMASLLINMRLPHLRGVAPCVLATLASTTGRSTSQRASVENRRSSIISRRRDPTLPAQWIARRERSGSR